jgi:HJR/Mrr/RecB family endonuclease
MSIWIYSDAVKEKEAVESALNVEACIFCATKLELFDAYSFTHQMTPHGAHSNFVAHCCPMCGWWTATRQESRSGRGDSIFFSRWGSAGKLRDLDMRDQSVPLEAIRSYLAARYDARFAIDPWKFEEVVASVFRDIGYGARVTGKTRDGGIDVILDAPDGAVIGVEVKRYKNQITVQQIRSLMGALIDKGLTRGIFVTTSTYSSDAEKLAERYGLRGRPVELLDAPRFYDALRLAQRAAYKSADDETAPFRGASMVELVRDKQL